MAMLKYFSNKEISRRMKLIKELKAKIVDRNIFAELDMRDLVRLGKLDTNTQLRYKTNIAVLSKFCDGWIGQANNVLANPTWPIDNIVYIDKATASSSGYITCTPAPLIFDYFATERREITITKTKYSSLPLRCDKITEKRNFNYWVKQTMKYWNAQIKYINSIPAI